MSEEEISFTNIDYIQKIHFPPFVDSIEHQMLLSAQLTSIIQDINENPDVRIVVIEGNEISFNFQTNNLPSPQTEKEMEERQIAQLIANIKCPTIMLCSGSIIAQGFEICLSTDIRICSSNTVFQMPQLYWNQLPWDGGTQRLSRLIGIPKSLDLMLTGRNMNAEEALQSGLIHQMTEPNKLETTGIELAKQMSEYAPIAMQYTKEAILNGYELPLNAALTLELDFNVLLHSTHDRLEGINSFLEKRTPDFQGS